MKYQIKEISKVEQHIHFSPEFQELQDGRQRTAEQFSKHMQLPGFRKGKVPLNVVLQRHKQEVDEAFAESFVFEHLPKILSEKNWSVIDPGVFIEREEKSGNWINEQGQITVRLEILPDHPVTIPKIPLEAEEVQVEESEVDQEIESFRFRLSEVVPLSDSRPAQPKDVLLLKEIKEQDTDKNIYRYEILDTTAEQKPDDFIGVRVGEIRSVNWEVGQDPNSPDSTKVSTPIKIPRTFLCQEIATRVLPEVNEAFCKKLGVFESVDALRATIRKDLLTRKTQKLHDKNRALIIKYMVEANDVPIPGGLEQRMFTEQLRAAIHTLSSLKVSEDGIKQYLDKTQEAFRKEAQSMSKFFIISIIYSNSNHITVTPQEVEQLWKRLNSNGSSTDPSLEDSKRLRLKQMILEEKVLEAIKKTLQAG